MLNTVTEVSSSLGMEEKKRNILMVGKKAGMTQLYDSSGVLIPVTVVEMCEAFVAGVRTASSDGYNAAVFGFGKLKRGIGNPREAENFDTLRELRVNDVGDYKIGESVFVDEFANGELVDVIGITKGKGFQGVMKRHGFSGGPASHGSMFHRRGGSFGQRQWPGHVFKGRKMPGHDGDKRRTVQNLKVMGVDHGRNLLIIKGGIPGSNGRYVVVRRAKKSLLRK
ncbi:MAG: 50S ribosomal protein L3 [Puniceicoccales bacterium]|jgi:large subunit ribosomal protein L3|nr:50S ribosomal protein L3 [Puniceicoccales bacterium]